MVRIHSSVMDPEETEQHPSECACSLLGTSKKDTFLCLVEIRHSRSCTSNTNERSEYFEGHLAYQ